MAENVSAASVVETWYTVRIAGTFDSGLFPTMTAAVVAGILSGLPFDDWEAVPIKVVGWIPITQIDVAGQTFVFPGRPGPLLPAAIDRVAAMSEELERMRPVDPRD